MLITQLATYIGYRLYGEAGVALAAGVLTLVLLLFAEVTPKTLAATNPEKIAFPAAYVYRPLSRTFAAAGSDYRLDGEDGAETVPAFGKKRRQGRR